MPKRSGNQSAPSAPIEEISETNIDVVEKEAIEKVNRTITVLEGALATWDAAKEKPVDLKDRFSKYKQFHDALMSWETRALRSKGKTENINSRVQRLREFVDLCYAYA
ncbi:MAG: hypothetical protein PHF60_04605 [Candidatus ainarchaeum sp.]|nr:hypothetical protein [Candidatus ainarchaeum sp.]